MEEEVVAAAITGEITKAIAKTIAGGGYTELDRQSHLTRQQCLSKRIPARGIRPDREFKQHTASHKQQRNKSRHPPTPNGHRTVSRPAQTAPRQHKTAQDSTRQLPHLIIKKFPDRPYLRTARPGTRSMCGGAAIGNYNFGPAATSDLPSSLPVNLLKFLMKRPARSSALTVHSSAVA